MTASLTQSSPTTASGPRRALGIAAAVVACNSVGLLGALFTSTETQWYADLVKPSFQPPGWIFGPMWTLLYTLMGVALYRVLARRDRDGARLALGLFAVQLALNGIWSPIFFGAQAIGLALVVIALLVVAVTLTIRQFVKVDRAAGWLLVPYLCWISFATILNGAIVALN